MKVAAGCCVVCAPGSQLTCLTMQARRAGSVRGYEVRSVGPANRHRRATLSAAEESPRTPTLRFNEGPADQALPRPAGWASHGAH